MNLSPTARRRAGTTIATLATAALVTPLAAGIPAGAASGRSSAGATAAAPAAAGLDKVSGKLRSPRGLAVVDGDTFLVAVASGKILRIRDNDGKRTRTTVGKVHRQFIAPSVDRHGGRIYVLTPEGPPGTGAATLYRFKAGHKPKKLADIAAYQQRDPDPYDREDNPGESNPFGLAVLDNGAVLVADAAGNDLLRVSPKGKVSTVARLKPRTVTVPKHLPRVIKDPEGGSVHIKKAGQKMRAEAVATSVTVGDDGYWYVGELRGVPATPKTSQVWRIKPGTRDAVCDPRHPRKGDCKRYADGLTSVVDLAADDSGDIYAAELSRKSWLKWELGRKGAKIGRITRIDEDRQLERIQRLRLPGNVDTDDSDVYVTNPVFGRGAIRLID